MPLGANAVTMEDVCRMYYALVTGGIHVPAEGGEDRSVTFLIQRIESPDGEVLYQAQPHFQQIIHAHQAGPSAEILRKVVSNGTGHQAETAFTLDGPRNEKLLQKAGIRVPALGKTGTSNDYRDSSFVGFIPGPLGGSLSLTLGKGVAIATYVGYDDNRPMKNAHIRVYGAAGALPIWIPVAQAAIRHLNMEDRLDLVELAFRPTKAVSIQWPSDLVEVPVDAGSGLPRSMGSEGSRVHTYAAPKGEKVDLQRFFNPVGEWEKGT
jgi:membrane peptidoglycan carboxypeptidase